MKPKDPRRVRKRDSQGDSFGNEDGKDTLTGGKPMATASTKDRLIRVFLIGLIISFFMIPAVTFCFFDCKFFIAKRTAHVLLVFFR
jgi:hypothetical protein